MAGATLQLQRGKEEGTCSKAFPLSHSGKEGPLVGHGFSSTSHGPPGGPRPPFSAPTPSSSLRGSSLLAASAGRPRGSRELQHHITGEVTSGVQKGGFGIEHGAPLKPRWGLLRMGEPGPRGSLAWSLGPDTRTHHCRGQEQGMTGAGGVWGQCRHGCPSPGKPPRGAAPTSAVLSIHSLDTS